MSKAFTKEGDGPSLDDLPPVDAWPEGIKNYLTPAGYDALRREMDALRDRPHGGDPRKKLLAETRLAALQRRLEAAEVVDPAGQPHDVVRFGATVTIEDEEGRSRRYRIVGVDEADPKQGWVSWRSPIATALVGKKVGETAILRAPGGREELEVVAIEY